MHYDPLTERCSECDRRVCICEEEVEDDRRPACGSAVDLMFTKLRNSGSVTWTIEASCPYCGKFAPGHRCTSVVQP